MTPRPSTHEEWVDAVRGVVARLEAAADLRSSGGRDAAAAVIRDDIAIISALLPGPIKVGDRVKRFATENLTFEVVAQRGEASALWAEVGGFGVWWATADLLRAEDAAAPAPSDTEPEPVECDDPEALAAAVAAGQVVEWRLCGDEAWRTDDVSTPMDYAADIKAGYRHRIWPAGSTRGGES